MRNLFNAAGGAAATAIPAAGGMSGVVKLGITGGIAAAVVAAVMWPSFFPSAPPPQPQSPNEQHLPPRISDYEQPPAAQDVVARVTGTAATAEPARRRPVPTEMALYTAKTATPATAATNEDPGQGGISGPSNPQAPGWGDPDNKLNAALGGATILPTMHATLVHNPDFVIRAGDVIPCLPVDAQNSSRPGFTVCRVPQWFRGSNQRRGLLPPGSRFFGQIKSGLLQNEERLGVLYTMIQTPRFNMPLAAPAADAMGRGGLDGDIHTFFWDRAGAVAAYALLDMAVGTGQNLATSSLSNLGGRNGNNTTLSLNNGGQSLASKEFDRTINKAPVLTRDQALPITVTIGQDLDFTDACRQSMRVDPLACPLQ
jgi:type IV secretion system protein VirB10